MAVFAYYDPETEGLVYHVIPSPNSEYAPSTIHSESDSGSSQMTIESDDLPGYFIVHHGRQQAASENVVKWFPPDNIRRYVARYLVAKSVFGGDYIGPVKEMLAPLKSRQRQALELGTRTGTWIQAMAAEFPHVKFRTIDVVPMMPHVPCRNIEFEVYDFTQGLLLDDGSQDVVFLNMVLEVVRDYRELLRDVYRVLRPGGLIFIHDWNPGIWGPEDIMMPAKQTTNPYGYYLFNRIREFLSRLGIDPDACNHIPQWLEPDSGIWKENQKGFKDIQLKTATAPAYPHDGSSCMDQIDVTIAPYLRHMTTASLYDMIGLLKDTGLTEEETEILINASLEEAKHHKSCALLKGYCIHAVKI